MLQPSLFAVSPALPEGMLYRPDFLSQSQEEGLLGIFSGLPFHEAQYKEWSAKRRVVSYGGRFDFGRNVLLEAEPVPGFLHSLREQIAEWSGIPAAAFGHALIAEYAAGTQLGWHRDVPNFGTIVGVSLAGTARMRLRRYPPQTGRGRATLAVDLEPRSAYVLSGAARWDWQHAISPTRALRYSITFRTLSP